MRLFLEEEERFSKELKVLAYTNSGYRCLLLRLSHFESNRDEWLPHLEKILKEEFSDDLNDTYIAHDNDVFIIGRFWTQKRSNQLLKLLVSHLPQNSNLMGLVNLYELGKHSVTLRDICARKIENKKIAQIRKGSENKQNLKNTNRYLPSDYINPQLIASIQDRRGARDATDIMVVEDDTFSRELIGKTLNKQFSVCLTGDGESALMHYVKKVPSILFLDIDLPDMNGHEVLQTLLQIDPSAYVIMLSANSDKTNILKAMNSGAKGFVTKPFTKDKLIQYIEKSPFIHKSHYQGEPA